jgi:hypothetical protein
MVRFDIDYTCIYVLMSLQLPVQSVPITTKVVSLNPAYGEMYLIQHYVIKFVTKLTPVFYTNKTDHHDITEILLKIPIMSKCT